MTAILRGAWTALVGWVHTAICALTDPEGRKGWAMLAALACAVSMTGYAVASLWLVRRNPMLAFWLGLAALTIVLVVITGLMVLLGVRRNTDVDLKDGKVSISEPGMTSAPVVTPPKV